MSKTAQSVLAAVPSLDRLLRHESVAPLLAAHGRAMVISASRPVLDGLRETLPHGSVGMPELALRIQTQILATLRPSLRQVFNLTGTVLHTNLGRAPLPREAIDAMVAVAGGASNLEFDLASGKRGDRDTHIESWICRLTGAEAATVVNNNAAAVLLLLNTLAKGREVPVSRGELIEIGGAFRIPDIMTRAGCRLVEAGTTNRTHAQDFETAIGSRTALLMKVHTSNYAIEGFTADVSEMEMARIAHARDLPLVVDLGSGTLIDLTRYGLPKEPTVAATLLAGADLVCFSGDKLLGGPQAGVIAGRKDLITKIKRNPMKRALRCDKLTIAALGAVLALYGDPDRLAQKLPALRLLTRPLPEITAQATRLLPALQDALKEHAEISLLDVKSQIGSGALPVDLLPSTALCLSPTGKRSGTALNKLAAGFRALPFPVIGRVRDGALLFDLRCLDDETAFLEQLNHFSIP
ncbi:MAG: L-seryl-tRNA(Sec) selenium transferase [Alphaproteobacteria bacterium]